MGDGKGITRFETLQNSDVRLETMRSVGGLWGRPVLSALKSDPTKLAGTEAADYGLPARLQLTEAIRSSWTVLKAAWDDFEVDRRARVAHLAKEWYGTDDFTITGWLPHLFDQLAYHAPHPLTDLDIYDAEGERSAERNRATYLWSDRVLLNLLPAGVSLDGTLLHVPGVLRQSHHSSVQEYLARVDRPEWGIITNGMTLRLLNTTVGSRAYLECDLAATFQEKNFPDFVVLWMALHATRFSLPSAESTCIADQWQQYADDIGSRDMTYPETRGGVGQISPVSRDHPDGHGLSEAELERRKVILNQLDEVQRLRRLADELEAKLLSFDHGGFASPKPHTPLPPPINQPPLNAAYPSSQSRSPGTTHQARRPGHGIYRRGLDARAIEPDVSPTKESLGAWLFAAGLVLTFGLMFAYQLDIRVRVTGATLAGLLAPVFVAVSAYKASVLRKLRSTCSSRLSPSERRWSLGGALALALLTHVIAIVSVILLWLVRL